MPAAVEIYPGSKVDISVTGTVPMNTSIVRNTSDLVFTSESVHFLFHPYEEGNYTCVATNGYGSDSRDFSIVYRGKTYPQVTSLPKLNVSDDINTTCTALWLSTIANFSPLKFKV